MLIAGTDAGGGGSGGNVFFNVGSVSNLLEPPGILAINENLRVRMRMGFIDPTVDEAFRFEPRASIKGPDPFLPADVLTDRPVAGFRLPLQDGAAVSLPAQLTVADVLPSLANLSEDGPLDSLFPLYWDYAPDRFDVFVPETPVRVDAAVDDREVPNGGSVFYGPLWPYLALESEAFLKEARVQQSWDFLSDDSGTSTVGGVTLQPDAPSIARAEHIESDEEFWQTSLLFGGEDRVSNQTPATLRSSSNDEPQRRLAPLRLWWMLDTGARLTSHTDGAVLEPEEADFTWETNRGFNPETVGGPFPLFTYQLFGDVAGTPTGSPSNGPYLSIGSWQEWGPLNPSTPELPARVFQELAAGGNAVLDNWLLLVVQNSDEAGNISQWPGIADLAATPFLDFNDQLNPAAWPVGNENDLILQPGAVLGRDVAYVNPGITGPRSPNWIRFRINDNLVPDTSLEATLWWRNYQGPIVAPGPPPSRAASGPGGIAGDQQIQRNPEAFPMPPEDLYGGSLAVVSLQGRVSFEGLNDPELYDPASDVLYLLLDLRRTGANSGNLLNGGNNNPLRIGPLQITTSTGIVVADAFEFTIPLVPTMGFGTDFINGFANIAGRFVSNQDTWFTVPFADAGRQVNNVSILGDPERRVVTEYVLTAQTFVDRGGGATPGVPDVSEFDPTPATYRFIITPDENVREFFSPRRQPEDQPSRESENL